MSGESKDKDSGAGMDIAIANPPNPLKRKIKCPPVIDDRHYSLVRSELTKSDKIKIIAKCLLCEDGREISGSDKSSGNFNSHLESHHKEEYKRMKQSKNCSSNQSTLQKYVTDVTKGAKKDLDNLISNYITRTMRPLSTVDHTAFKELIDGARKIGYDPNVNLLTRYGLDRKLKQGYADIVEATTVEMKNTDYVCMTADCWSSRSKAFMGVTGHWIAAGDLSRVSRSLACVRFKGIHSYDRIADCLLEVMKKYAIPLQKVVNIITDNGTNFCKAFTVFGTEFEELAESHRHEVLPVLDEDRTLANQEVGDEEDEEGPLYHTYISESLEGSPAEKMLPPHFRCVSHTLSLIATTDIAKVKEKQLYYKVMGKCTKLWNLSTSPKSAEIIRKLAKKNFKRPCPTRWNSLYDSIERTIEMKAHLDSICEQLNVPAFSAKEIDFLEEFYKVSSPVSKALDRMQGERGLYMGAVLPTLQQVQRSLLELKSNAKLCAPFAEAYLSGLRKRFGKPLEFSSTSPTELVFAAMCHPYFKLRWLDESKHEDLKKAFIQEARKYFSAGVTTTETEADPEPFDPFFDFDKPESHEKRTPSSDDVERECYMFFNEKSLQLSSLKKFPTIEKMFRRYNTSLPSSAPVERLFSYGGQILSSRRSTIGDEKFEELLLLKTNDVFKSSPSSNRI